MLPKILSALFFPFRWLYRRHVEKGVYYKAWKKQLMTDLKQYKLFITMEYRVTRWYQSQRHRVNPFWAIRVHLWIINLIAICNIREVLQVIDSWMPLWAAIPIIILILDFYVQLITCNPVYAELIWFKNPVTPRDPEAEMDVKCLLVNTAYRAFITTAVLSWTWVVLSTIRRPGFSEVVSNTYEILAVFIFAVSGVYILLPTIYYFLLHNNEKVAKTTLGVLGTIAIGVVWYWFSLITLPEMSEILDFPKFQVPWWLNVTFDQGSPLSLLQIFLLLLTVVVGALIIYAIVRIIKEKVNVWWQVPLWISWQIPLITVVLFWLLIGYQYYNPQSARGVTISANVQMVTPPDIALPPEPPAVELTEAPTEAPTAEPIATELPTATAEPVATPPSFTQPEYTQNEGVGFDKYTHIIIIYQSTYSWEYMLVDYKTLATTGFTISKPGYGIHAIAYMPKNRGELKWWVVTPPSNNLEMTKEDSLYSEQVSASVNNMNDLKLGVVSIWRSWESADNRVPLRTSEAVASPSTTNPDLQAAISFLNTNFSRAKLKNNGSYSYLIFNE